MCNLGLFCFVVGIKINRVFILCGTKIGANKMELWNMGIVDKDWIRVNLHVKEKLIGHASYPEIKFVYNSPYLSCCALFPIEGSPNILKGSYI